MELKGYKIFVEIVSNRKVQLLILLILFSVTVPLLTFYYLIQEVKVAPYNSSTCVIDPTYRVPCGLDNLTCNIVSCCVDPTVFTCYHSIPAIYNYEKIDELTYKPTVVSTPHFTDPVERLTLTINDIHVNKTQIILHDASVSYSSIEIAEKNYQINKDTKLLGIEVFRKATLEMLLTTFRGPLIASNGYWEWTFQLTNEKLVGLGEIVFNKNETVTKVIYKNENDHNTLPIFLAYLKGQFHGVIVEHDGPLEVTVLPSKLIILKSLAGNKIILNLCVGGNRPEDVINQLRPRVPTPVPYWVLGAHICRDGLTTKSLAINEYKKFVDSEIDIHFVSDCIHENLYFLLKGTTDENVRKLIEKLQAKSHFMLSMPPHVLKGALYNKAIDLGILYLFDNKTYHGKYLGELVAYPDFSHNSIDEWMKELIASLPVAKPDGFVLNNNWPVDESYTFVNNKRLQYLTEDISTALNKTIPFDAYIKRETSTVQHIQKHNQYGAAQATAFKENIKSDFLMTSSCDYSGPEAALVQNINISWPNLKRAITTTIYNNIFRGPLISIPICGSTKYYNKDIHEELCIRWYILAATSPLFRISSDLPRRDPSSLATKFATGIAHKAIQRRSLLLPYYYTVLNLNNMLVKPMFYDFHVDDATWGLDEQYMLGDALLVVHPVLPLMSKLQLYLPPSAGVWFEFWGGKEYKASGWLNIDIVESDWVMFIQQGHIVPLRNNTSSRIGSYGPTDTYTFAIALNCTGTNICTSKGLLMLTSTTLKLNADYRGILLTNIVLAKEEIGCDLVQRIWPSIIKSAIIYGIKNDTASYSTFKPIDLCEYNQDDLYIEYMAV